MTNSAIKACADDPRARRGVIRALLYTLPLVIFVFLALVPLSANVDFDSGVSVQRCEAFADAEPNIYAYSFLSGLSQEMGLPVGDAVATVAGVVASGTGLVITTESGLLFGDAPGKSLDNLADAADYPDWDTLTTSQQESWVSKENYDASKFNSLLGAFGLDNARDRFYSSGGSALDLNENERRQVDRLGRIGSLWSQRIGVAYSDLKDAITNRNSIDSWFPPTGNEREYDATGVSDWPSYCPVNLYYGSNLTRLGTTSITSDNKNEWYGFTSLSAPVYGLINQYPGNGYYALYTFSESYYTFDLTRQTLSKAKPSVYQATYNGHTYYWYRELRSTNMISSDLTVNQTEYAGVTATDPKFLGIILFGDGSSSSVGGEVASVPDYPEDEAEIPDSKFVYFPPEGVSPETPWGDYVEPQVPETPYNPGNQTGSDEWKQETEQNVMPLTKIRFDKLFPFCLMTDVKDVTEKIEETITPGEQSDYLRIRIPMAYASDGEGGLTSEEIELDGTPVRDLLIMVRPFNQALLLFLMVFTLVMFWKSILTGD